MLSFKQVSGRRQAPKGQILVSPRRHLLLLPCLLTATLPALAQEDAGFTMEAINSASLNALVGQPSSNGDSAAPEDGADAADRNQPEPAIARLQVLLDRAGASPGVIDGFDGANVRKAIAAIEMINELPVDGIVDGEFIARIETGEPVASRYTITAEDLAMVVGPLPEDYAELAEQKLLGFASGAEALAEKFHMDIDLLDALNPDANFAEGEEIVVADPGEPLEGSVARLEADKPLGQLRAYDSQDRLLVAYPATVGSDDNPSPAGMHTVRAIAPEPTYTYDPDVNFQQGDNTEALVLPPGPNNPVGTVWIDLSEPTYGIHGTPEPSEIDKTASHGCVRLTNWDAEELASMVEKGVEVQFMQ